MQQKREINTVCLTYWSLQVLPWNNDTTIVKMEGWKWNRHITDFFQYIHAWNQGGIVISIYDISLPQFLLCKSTVNLKKWRAATGIVNQLNTFEKRDDCKCLLPKRNTLENTKSLQVAHWNNDGTTQLYGCKCFFGMKILLE